MGIDVEICIWFFVLEASFVLKNNRNDYNMTINNCHYRNYNETYC